MKLLILIIGLTLTISSKGQNIISDSNIVYYKQSFFRFYPNIYMNGKRLKKIEQFNTFKQIPEAFADFTEYRKTYNKSLYSYFGFIIGIGISAIGSENNSQTFRTSGLVFSIVSFSSAIIFMSKGESKLKKAIRLYNKKVQPNALY